MKLRIVYHRVWWLVLSGIALIPGLIFLALGGLRLSTDFTGGSLRQVQFTGERPSGQQIADVLKGANGEVPTLQLVGEQGALIRMRELTQEEHAAQLAFLQQAFPGVREEAYSSVGPTIGKELRQRAIVAVILVLIGIILYISWAFRKTSGRISGWAFGANAILALIHDIGITIGFFAVLGYFFHVEVDALFVTALLTVLGFSVHDTIVVFDRVREGLRRSPGGELDTIINDSVNTTLVRSINTSFTAVLVLVALYLFGGTTIKYFVLALIVGIVAGTYSSIFIASPLLPWWVKVRRRA